VTKVFVNAAAKTGVIIDVVLQMMEITDVIVIMDAMIVIMDIVIMEEQIDVIVKLAMDGIPKIISVNHIMITRSHAKHSQNALINLQEAIAMANVHVNQTTIGT